MTRFTNTIKRLFILLLITFFCFNVSGQSRNVLDFNGLNDYIDISSDSTLSGNTLSVQLWVRINSNTGGRQTIITSGGKSSIQLTQYKIYAEPDGKWNIILNNQGRHLIDISAGTINYGVWTNIALTYDHSAIRVYVDGALITSFAISGLSDNIATFPMRLGAENTEGSANDFFAGQMDDLTIWNKALSPTEVLLYTTNPVLGNEHGLLSYYNFNEVLKQSYRKAAFNFALNGSSPHWISLSALPVSLVSFSGSKKDGFNLLEWSTASEQNTRNFEIQRSVDGNDFSAIATVSAAGNSDRTLNYQYDDRSLAASPVYYYRLKMVDLDGAAKFSSIIFIKNAAILTTTVYPNPAIDHITINVSDKNLLNTSAVLSDLNGKVLQRISLTQTSTQVNVSSYTRGMYLLKFNDGTSIKIVKE